MRSLILGLTIAVAGASAADAAVTLSSTAYDLAAPVGAGPLVDFDDPSLGGFTLTGSGYLIQSGDNGLGAAPAAGPTDATDDQTNYLSVYGGWAKLMGATSYHNVSLFWGSMDGYNALDLLDAAGNVFQTITYDMIPAGGNGDQLNGWTNRRVDIASTDDIFGIQFRSTQPAFEADNITFSGHIRPGGGDQIDVGGAVPEPASWALMLTGFGAVGGAMRANRRKVLLAA